MYPFNLTEQEKQARKQTDDVRKVLQQQIVGAIDVRRSKEYWTSILANFQPDAIAEALSSELTHFNYREIARSPCCCKR